MKSDARRELRNHSTLVGTSPDHIEDTRPGELSRRSDAAPAKPDFAARRKAIWGDRVFSDEEVREMRELELEGEQG